MSSQNYAAEILLYCYAASRVNNAMPCHHTTGTTYDTFFKLKMAEKTESKETNQTEKGKGKQTGIEKTVVPPSGDVASTSKEPGKETAPTIACYILYKPSNKILD